MATPNRPFLFPDEELEAEGAQEPEERWPRLSDPTEAAPSSLRSLRTPMQSTVSQRATAAAFLACLIAAVLVATGLVARAWPAKAHVRGAAEELAEVGPPPWQRQPVGPGAESQDFCGRAEEGTEFHTRNFLYWLSGVDSQEACCAECDGDPECGAWTWGKPELAGLSSRCFLRRLEQGEEPQRMPRPGFVSGLLKHKLRKHGVVAGLLSKQRGSQAQAAVEVVRENETCRGEVSVAGHGLVSVVNALWMTPSERSASVDVPGKSWAIAPQLGSRAYLAESCRAGQFSPGDYAHIRPLGMAMRYTVDVSGAGCGCNAQLRLVPLQLSGGRSKCQDFFCSPGAVGGCGTSCAHISLQEANQYAWFTGLRLHDDPEGAGVGYGGGEPKHTGRRSWGDAQYGPGAACIDTAWPFQVEVAFPVDKAGNLEAVDVTLSQDGRMCPLTARLDRYAFDGRDGLGEISKLLDAGVTPVLSYDSSSELQWLDGLGLDGKGPCVQDTPAACAGSVRFYDLALDWSTRTARRPAARAGVSPWDPLDIAASAVHQGVFDAARAQRQEALSNATALELAAGAGEGPDCSGDCTAMAEDIMNLSAAAEHARGVKKAATGGSIEWEVMAAGVPVKSAASLRAKTIARRERGQVLVGERTGEWVKLSNEPGFVAVSHGDDTFLRKRAVTYDKVESGSCADRGWFPIADASTCMVAAFTLGYFDTTVKVYEGSAKRPEGCYLQRGQLWLATHVANTGNGADEDRTPICSSRAHPTTTSTLTSTTTQTTLLTTTATTTTTTTTSATTLKFELPSPPPAPNEAVRPPILP